MQTIRFLPQAKQLRKARESLEVFVPVSEQLHLPTVTSELETLASATLTQRQLRVRVVVHAGTVFYDANGCFGETRAGRRQPARRTCQCAPGVTCQRAG
jgi:hypothetical protein